jgi:hypothetical protein
MPFAAGLALAVSLVLNGGSLVQASAPASIMPVSQSPKEFVSSYFADIPIMIDISRCESHFHQYDADGSVYRGQINNLDVGIMQINEHYHADVAKKLGLDLYTMQGNVAYARYLYDKEGTAPWSSSESCWGPAQAGKTAAIGAVVATTQK